MKAWFVFVGTLMLAAAVFGFIRWRELNPDGIIAPIGTILDKPLEKFSIPRLIIRGGVKSAIVFDEPIATESAYSVRPFRYSTDGKTVSGLAHIPNAPPPSAGFPVVVQFRGYIDPQRYAPGDGTRHSAEVFAANGFVSLAPDFLGFGLSDALSDDIFRDRFETYTTAIDLIVSVDSIPFADAANIGVWGHSNGGHIAITALEILGKPYPLVLWAPVTKPFPYSVLYYTDEAPDGGKYLRRELAGFEKLYDADRYSLTNYLRSLKSPVEIHQGSLDSAVPQSWSDAFVATLKANSIDVTYYVYPGADHDLSGSWNTAMNRTIDFFRQQIQ